MEEVVSDQISTLLKEQRLFRPAPGFKRVAHVRAKRVYQEAGAARTASTAIRSALFALSRTFL